MDQAAEHLDRSALRSDDLVADDPRDDLVVPDAPRCDALVPLDQRFRELIELLVLAPVDVKIVEREPRCGERRLEGIAERRRDTANPPKAGRIELGAVAEDAADRLVLSGRHLLEHVERGAP